MAEFVDVMDYWNKMCAHASTCDDCKVDICNLPHDRITREDAEETEAAIMQWVAEHNPPTEEEEKLFRKGYELGYSEGRLNALLEVRRMLGES